MCRLWSLVSARKSCRELNFDLVKFPRVWSRISQSFEKFVVDLVQAVLRKVMDKRRPIKKEGSMIENYKKS